MTQKASFVFPAENSTGNILTYDSLKADGHRVEQVQARFVRYTNGGFKGTNFEGVTFQHCYFVNCYFRLTEFRSVHFLDCSFEDCNFTEAVFLACQLEYCEFRNCNISYRQVVDSLPPRFNVRRDVVRTLKVNANTRGMADDARRFLLEELNASRAYNKNKAFNYHDAYFSKYGFVERVRGFKDWLGLVVSSMLWGYGEKPFRVVTISGVLIVAFALLYWFVGIPDIGTRHNLPFADDVGLSVASFITVPYGVFLPSSAFARIAVVAEGCVGLVFFGFLVAAIFRRISQR